MCVDVCVCVCGCVHLRVWMCAFACVCACACACVCAWVCVCVRAHLAGHPSLVLVEALDLGQINRGGAFHLKALLGWRIHTRQFTFIFYSILNYSSMYRLPSSDTMFPKTTLFP